MSLNTPLHPHLPAELLKCCTAAEIDYLSSTISHFKGLPNIPQLWQLIDCVWDDLSCDPYIFDSRIKSFYSHPVWIVNYLSANHDSEAAKHQQSFKDWILSTNPLRILDYGGGFGSISRLIATESPSTLVEILEPYPHPYARFLAESYPNLEYVSKPSGTYDIILSLDVLEHVPDPMHAVYEVSAHLSRHSFLLTANCFKPVVKCHLPQHYHLDSSWDYVLSKMGLTLVKTISYGSVYQMPASSLNLPAAYEASNLSSRISLVLSHLPQRLRSKLQRLFFSAVTP